MARNNRRMKHVDFIVEGLDDHGGPSGRFLEVVEAVAIAPDGMEMARFKKAEQFYRFFHSTPINTYKLYALKTVGEPRSDLTGRYQCEQGVGA